jgi:hypothetical protein
MIGTMRQQDLSKQASDAVVRTVKKNPMERIGLGLLPFTPIGFTGQDAALAWIRVGLYATVAYFTYSKVKPLFYIASSAAVLSTVTSLASGAWKSTAEKEVEKIIRS